MNVAIEDLLSNFHQDLLSKQVKMKVLGIKEGGCLDRLHVYYDPKGQTSSCDFVSTNLQNFGPLGFDIYGGRV